ncbi:MAG: hypothetical protein DDT19_02912 [Syntrophomonadaceae bacterium]|nr:hypothetical protein [Bacillota bacterium]
MGFSIVTILTARSSFIMLIIEAKVVLFPLPVGPVTNTNPRGRRESSFTTSGRPRSEILGICQLTVRITTSTEPRCFMALPLKRLSPPMA